MRAGLFIVAVSFASTVAEAQVPGPTPPPPFDVNLDLATLPPGKSVLEVPAGKGVRVRAVNRAPAVGYNYWTEREGGPRPSAQTFLVLRDAVRLLHLSPECDAYQQAAAPVLSAVRESDVPRLLEAFRKEAAAHPCPRLEGSTGALLENTSPLIIWMTLNIGESMKVVIERVEIPGSVAPARWEVDLQALGAQSASRYRTETEWIVSEIVTDLAEMAARAAGRRLPPRADVSAQGAGVYRVGVRPPAGAAVTADVSLADTHAWAPSAYAEITRRLFGPNPPRPVQAEAAPTAVDVLLDPTPQKLAAEDARVSRRLGRDLRDQGAHQQAALLIATLALRESAGRFADVRTLLCRLTAHLAVARGLGGTARLGRDGATAEAALLALVGREADALAAVGSPAGNRDVSLESWRRALTLRVTGDWRSKEDARATLLEKTERLRALDDRLGPDAAMAFLESARPSPAADWGRILLGRMYSVEVANVFAPAQVRAELAESASVWKAYHAGEPTVAQLIRELGAPRRRCVVESNRKSDVAVLGWPTWAAFLRDHLLLAVDAQVGALVNGLGMREEAARASEALDAQLSDLEGYWMARALRPALQKAPVPTSPATYREPEVCEAVASRLKEHPESLLLAVSQDALRRCPSGRDTGRIPQLGFWFQPAMPAGTVFDAAQRLRTEMVMSLTADALAELHRQAPSNIYVAMLHSPRHFGQDPTLDDYRAEYGPLLDYDRGVLKGAVDLVVRRGGDPAPLYDQLCGLEAESCLDAGSFFAARERNEEALRAYEKAFASARDRVAVSAQSDWLVDYYFDHGRLDDAQRVANAAADVYSARGLFTMGRLMERLGRYDDAVTWYRRIAERYGNDTTLDEFYVRYQQRVHDGRFTEESRSALGRLFPEGLRKVTARDLPPPSRPQGMPVASQDVNEKLGRVGMRAGDLVMALDGYRVSDLTQWKVVRSFSDEPKLSAIVLRGGGYLEVAGPYVRLKFGR